ncbi:MAG: glycosyltransferase [Candidatus Nanopelagicaceae bacterium]|nr:glycosyltransferase [Candidatus Nanopelagicaceae bacterium]
MSGAQRNDFCKQPKFSKLPSVVTPVPINTEFNLGSNAPRNSLGFVGRIHEERDPRLWVEIANSLPEIPKLVVGDGPLLNEMRGALRSGEFTGVLAGDKLAEIWNRLLVLLSTAPYESYGLTIREALLHEVPVMAKTSAGAKDLALRFPNLVRLFENPEEAVALIYELRESPPTKDEFKSFREWFIESQSESLSALAKMWAAM